MPEVPPHEPDEDSERPEDSAPGPAPRAAPGQDARSERPSGEEFRADQPPAPREDAGQPDARPEEAPGHQPAPPSRPPEERVYASPSATWRPEPYPNPGAAGPYAGEATYVPDAGAPPAEAQRSRGRSAARFLRELAETVILALLIFLLVRAVVQNFQVEGRSMEPTLESGWYVLVNKAVYFEVNLETLGKFIPFIDPGDDPTRYIFRGPQRGDVIVFKAPNSRPGQPERDFIKRIIAEPGETIEIRDGVPYIDGARLEEPYIVNRSHDNYGPATVPPGHYFVMGDNRPQSQDSRSPSIGFVPKEAIIGQAWLTYWPFDAFGLIDNSHLEPAAGPAEQPDKEEVPVEEPVGAGAAP